MGSDESQCINIVCFVKTQGLFAVKGGLELPIVPVSPAVARCTASLEEPWIIGGSNNEVVHAVPCERNPFKR